MMKVVHKLLDSDHKAKQNMKKRGWKLPNFMVAHMQKFTPEWQFLMMKFMGSRAPQALKEQFQGARSCHKGEEVCAASFANDVKAEDEAACLWMVYRGCAPKSMSFTFPRNKAVASQPGVYLALRKEMDYYLQVVVNARLNKKRTFLQKASPVADGCVSQQCSPLSAEADLRVPAVSRM